MNFARFVLVASFICGPQMQAKHPVVIAHRGASGYAPEHTLAAVSLAHAMGADFIEPDVILTKDNIPIVMHDLTLEATTNVAKVYPNRQRKDGHWYAIDLTLSEIKTLSVNERRIESGNNKYPRRFPSSNGLFKVPTLDEWIELVQGLNKSRGKKLGIYPEIKRPRFHLAEGKDITKIVLKTLENHGYTKRDDNILLQCFDPQTLKRIRTDLKSDLRLIQLLAPGKFRMGDVDYGAMKTPAGLKTISGYAEGIGIWTEDLVQKRGSKYQPMKKLVQAAKNQGLQIHVYTLREDALPPSVKNWKQLIQLFYGTLRVDGAFTDFPDKVISLLPDHPSNGTP